MNSKQSLSTKYFILLSILLSSCGLFDTRDPENPVNGGSTFEPAVTPTLVLRNLESALTANNPNDYKKCFSDTSLGLPSYSFQPSAQGIAAAPSKFAEWGIVQEELYFKNIVSEIDQGVVCSVTFMPSEVSAIPVGDSVQFSTTYLANFPHTRENVERTAEGSLQFTLRKSSSTQQWYITNWKDLGGNGTTSWSLIKARFIDN